MTTAVLGKAVLGTLVLGDGDRVAPIPLPTPRPRLLPPRPQFRPTPPRLQIALSATLGGPVVADWSADCTDATLVWDEHGPHSLDVTLAERFADAATVLATAPPLHVRVSDGARTIWAGRLETPGPHADGLHATVLGYRRALQDLGHAALYSDVGPASWRLATEADVDSTRVPKAFESDNNNRLYLAPQKNAPLGGGRCASWVYEMPHRAHTFLQQVRMTVKTRLDSGWKARLTVYDYTPATERGVNGQVVWEKPGAGAAGAPTEAVDTVVRTFGPRAWVSLDVVRTAAGDYVGDTHDVYVLATDLRVMTTTAAEVGARTIVLDLLGQIRAVNDGYLSADTTLVQRGGFRDVLDAAFADKTALDIFDAVAADGDAQAVPLTWGVDEGGRIVLRQTTPARARQWYVDVADDYAVEQPLDAVTTTAYTTYRDALGRTRRTDDATDARARRRTGLTRRRSFSATTSSKTVAEQQRDVQLQDSIAHATRAGVHSMWVYDEAGTQIPAVEVRPGDTVTIRNLPPHVVPALADARSWTVGEVRYDLVRGVATLSPRDSEPRLEHMLAQQDAGARY